jgi:hypothetical protein
MMKMIHQASTLAWVLGMIGLTIVDINGLALFVLGGFTVIGLAGALLPKGGDPYSDEVAEQPVERKVAEVVPGSTSQLALPAARTERLR